MLTVDNLKVFFHTRNGIVRAVDGISFTIDKGETVGIVGESGSGKSVACLSLLGLVPQPPGRIESGQAVFSGVDLLTCSQKELRRIRGGRIAMVFQDPMTCLNPYLTIETQLTEALLAHKNMSGKAAGNRAIDLLTEVGIQDAEKRISLYPHAFSGGMRQRVMIAMALITEPELLIADEPTTALDVTIQAQILDLLKELQQNRGMAMVFITHDLGVTARIADRVMVMYCGKVMEKGTVQNIFYHPCHPYTRALMKAMPSACAAGEQLYTIPGMPPEPLETISGCAFAPRCRTSDSNCRHTLPELKQVGPVHVCACLKSRESV